MFSIYTIEQFEKSFRKCIRNGKNPDDLWEVVEMLAEKGNLPEEFKPHQLRDRLAGLWECHIEDDWLLIWKQDNKRLPLLLADTGSHDYLFG